MTAVLLLLASCSSPPSTLKSVSYYKVQTIAPTSIKDYSPISNVKNTSLPKVKYSANFVVFQLGQIRIIIMDKKDRLHIFSKEGFYDDGIISDLEAQLFEVQKQIEAKGSETDSLTPALLSSVE